MSAKATRTPSSSANGMAKPLVLIVEDEIDLITLLQYNLEKEGFRTINATDGQEALLLAQEQRPSLILLDWMLPVISGIEVCRQLRRNAETQSIPIIMLTARSDEADKVRGLNSGADDYLAKPFSPSELVARIRAVLRRANPGTNDELLQYGDVVVDLAAHRVRRNGRDIHLGPTEFRLLRHFMSHPGRVFSREQLLDFVWGNDVFVEARTVDVHIRRLRKVLNSENEADLIRTVRSAGYALDAGNDL
jgi:two-component system, OmpR family, phosphate regulon response regulator PhoB